jgi:hypothetical protein
MEIEMSAYMVSKEHIDAIVATAVHGPSDNGKPGGYGQRRWYPLHIEEDGEQFPVTVETASRLGEMLVKENLSSIHYRYPDTITNPDSTPGPIAQYWLTEYKFPQRTKPLTIVQACKALAGYEYQSCEHPEWRKSDAREFCNELRDSLVGCLPGYDDAEWEVASA